MSKLAYPIVTLAGVAAVLLLLATGQFYQKGAIDLEQAFNLLRIGALMGIAGAGFSIFFLLWQRPQGLNLAVIVVSAALGIVAFYMPYRQLLLSQHLPAIHDITTDFNNPPAFVAIARVRTTAHNPVAYAGPETAALQRQAYPDIRTLMLAHSSDAVFAASMQVIDDIGWRIAEANQQQGRIEVTATSQWFGLKDDMVIRLVPGAAGSTTFDMRSKSRVGITDVGSNARHIRAFTAALNAELQQQ
jgi:uncharacterized protein (DUF1499 family)